MGQKNKKNKDKIIGKILFVLIFFKVIKFLKIQNIRYRNRRNPIAPVSDKTSK